MSKGGDSTVCGMAGCVALGRHLLDEAAVDEDVCCSDADGIGKVGSGKTRGCSGAVDVPGIVSPLKKFTLRR